MKNLARVVVLATAVALSGCSDPLAISDSHGNSNVPAAAPNPAADMTLLICSLLIFKWSTR